MFNIDEKRQEIFEFGSTLFNNPELGFKEYKTKELIIEYLAKYGLKPTKEYFGTGFEVTIGHGAPHIGMIAELDAIPTLNHPCASKVDNAAHACGHSTQVCIMTNALIAINESHILDKGGSVTLFYTPAEEYTDLAYREELVKQGKIKYLAGKINMIAEGIFNDVDLIIHLHGMGEFKKYKFSCNSHLAGFKYKKFIFKGKASHAAVMPSLGHNALNAFTLFNNCLGFMRETFKEEDMNRVHGMVTCGGQTVNSIPEEVVYEAYVRSFNADKLNELSNDLTNAAKHCAQALKCDCEVIDSKGYLPFVPSTKLSELAYKHMLAFADPKQIIWNEKSVAAGDIGDVSTFKPMIQFGYTGFTGVMHGRDLMVVDEEMVYIEPMKIVINMVNDMINDPSIVDEIVKDFEPVMTYEEYMDYLTK